VGNDEQFLRFCAVADRADIARDLRFRTIADRNAHRDILLPILAEVMRSRHSDDWIEALEHNNVPCGPINSIDKVFADPQVRSRGMRLDLPHARAGHVPSIASPMRFSQTPIEYSLAPPMLGEHTGEVLADLLDIGAEEAAKLRAQGTI
jgi:crotonobetainyl-CoA:carnitine CoA-transferase CaiB-like acyl-CoA transferase